MLCGSVLRGQCARGGLAYVKRATQWDLSSAGRLNRRTMYVDAHCHLTHRLFGERSHEVARAAAEANVSRVCVNGLDSKSNQEVLDLCSAHANLVPAAGIHPLHSPCELYEESKWDLDMPMPQKFDVAAEILRIRDWAATGKIAAIGECGLDAFYYQNKELLAEQERVLEELCTIAVEFDLPVILHSRKREARVFELVQACGVSRAIFHCFSGRHKLAKRIAAAGYYVSISATVVRVAELQKLAAALPLDRILTETDAPFLAPIKGEMNEPLNVVQSCAAIAKARGEAAPAVARQILENFDTCVSRGAQFLKAN